MLPKTWKHGFNFTQEFVHSHPGKISLTTQASGCQVFDWTNEVIQLVVKFTQKVQM